MSDPAEYSAEKAAAHPERLAALRKGWRFPPSHLNIDLVAGRCSQRCFYCVGTDPRGFGISRPDDEKHEFFPEERLRALPREMKEAGVEAVEITGFSSEPTLHPGFVEFTRGLREVGLPYGLITNGDKLHDGPTFDAACHAAFVRVSLDSLREETDKKIRNPRPGESMSLASRLEMVRALAKAKSPSCVLGIGTVVVPANVDEVANVARFAYQAGCDNVRFVWVQHEKSAQLLPPDVREAAKARLDEWKRMLVQTSARPFRIHGPGAYDSTYAWPDRPPQCGYTQFVANVEVDGDVFGCCQARGVKRLTFGNVLRQSLTDIFYSARREEVLRGIDPRSEPICASCIWSRHVSAIARMVNSTKASDEGEKPLHWQFV